MDRWFVGVRGARVWQTRARAPQTREVRLLGGSRYVESLTVWEPPRRFGYEVHRPPRGIVRWSALVTVRPSPEGADVAYEARFEPALGRAGRILGRLLVAPVVGAAFAISLRRLRSRIRHAGSRGARRCA